MKQHLLFRKWARWTTKGSRTFANTNGIEFLGTTDKPVEEAFQPFEETNYFEHKEFVHDPDFITDQTGNTVWEQDDQTVDYGDYMYYVITDENELSQDELKAMKR